MKTIKKALALILTLAIVMSLGITAFAAETDHGSITIGNPNQDATYKAYRLLDLVSFDAANDTFNYKVADKWKTFFSDGVGKDMFELDKQGEEYYVKGPKLIADTNLEDKKVTPETKSDWAIRLAKLVSENKARIVEDYTLNRDNSFKATFSVDTEMGYFFVDTTLGSLCSLDTSSKDVTIYEKNVVPGNEKTVTEDSNTAAGNDKGADTAAQTTNTADVGDTVLFEIKVDVPSAPAIDGAAMPGTAGAQNLVVHDAMEAGLTWTGAEKVTVEHHVGGASVGNVLTKTTDFNVAAGDEGVNPCTFHVTFTDSFLKTVKNGDYIVVKYSAVVNEGAITDADGVKNTSKVAFGDNHVTETDYTVTKTFPLTVAKYAVKNDGSNDYNKPLAGAKFTLSYDAAGSNKINLVASGTTDTYNVCTIGTAHSGTHTHVTEVTTGAAGVLYIRGLDAGTYYLTETAAPTGYTPLDKPVEIVVGTDGAVKYKTSGANGGYSTVGKITLDPDGKGEGVSADVNNAVQVLNQAGNKLPATGGMGTTIFYTVGALMMVCALVMLITKKKMSAN